MDASTGDTVLRRFSAFVDLTSAEERLLRTLLDRVASFQPKQTIRSEGAEPFGVFVLHEGWAISAVTTADGVRQIPRVHRPGDFLGFPSLPFEAVVESLIALTPCTVSTIALANLGRLFVEAPRLGAVMFLLAQEERTSLMDRLVSSGALDAKRRVAAFLLVLHRDGPTVANSTVIHQPLTQDQLGEALGLSTVHVNRTLRLLDDEGYIRRDRQTWDLVDVGRLEALVGLPRRVRRRNPTWLPEPR